MRHVLIEVMITVRGGKKSLQTRLQPFLSNLLIEVNRKEIHQSVNLVICKAKRFQLIGYRQCFLFLLKLSSARSTIKYLKIIKT